ncbi:MAG TPA: branched-chain amino acid ABC transporter permease, partial [Pseudolabrys sp.]
MVGLQILIDGFAISSLYALGAMGFTLIFGVSGVLNLSHGGIMAIAAVIGWLAAGDLGFGVYLGTLVGVAAGLVASYVTYFIVILPIQRSKAIPRDETEIFILTGTLLWGIMIQVGLAYLFTDNPVTMRPLIDGVTYIAGVRVPKNEIMIAIICWIVIGLLWLLVNKTPSGKRLLAASINPRGLTLLGFDLSRIYFFVWGIYGVLAGVAGVLLASFLGVSSASAGQLTASAFSIVVLGGLGSVS